MVSDFCGELDLDHTHDISLALQWVSGFSGELDLDPAHSAYPWLSRK